MSTQEDRDQLAAQLAVLPVHELVDVLRRVLPHFTEDHYGIRTALVLATATHFEDEQSLSLELVAWPDRDYYDGGLGPDQGLWEDGSCATCDTDVTSNAKRAFCPACGSRCALT